jgi:hypothetical protein
MTYRDEIKVGDLVQVGTPARPTQAVYEVRSLDPDGDGRIYAGCLSKATGIVRVFPVEKLTKFRVMENER